MSQLITSKLLTLVLPAEMTYCVQFHSKDAQYTHQVLQDADKQAAMLMVNINASHADAQKTRGKQSETHIFCGHYVKVHRAGTESTFNIRP